MIDASQHLVRRCPAGRSKRESGSLLGWGDEWKIALLFRNFGGKGPIGGAAGQFNNNNGGPGPPGPWTTRVSAAAGS